MQPIISIRDLTKTYAGGFEALKSVDLDINRAGHLYTSTYDGIFRTTDGQDLWVRVATHSATWISISPVDGDIHVGFNIFDIFEVIFHNSAFIIHNSKQIHTRRIIRFSMEVFFSDRNTTMP